MDWSSVNFDWNRARAFLVTAEEGSLSAAARALGLAQPTLGRQIAALEQELEVALFERVGGGLTLTSSGLELLEHVRIMGSGATHLSLAASGQSQTIEGKICITASEVYSTYFLPPIIAKLRLLHPGIEVEIAATNDLRDLRRREADIAIRNARPTDPDLIAKKIRDDTARLYATPEYLAQIGHPSTKEDLSDATFIGFAHDTVLMDGLNAMGFSLAQKNFAVVSPNHLAQWAMARHGIGIGVVPTIVGDNDPSVRRVLPGLAPIVFPIWLVAHRELATSRRIRVVFDLLAKELLKGYCSRDCY